MPDELQDVEGESYKDYIKAREPRWRNVFGAEIDLDNIDRDYALNILLMAHARRVRMGFTRDDMIEDRLMQKLREVVLDGRKPSARDRIRASAYNVRCRLHGLPYRAGR